MQRLTIILNHFFDPDNESDTEVPYADIMITVRGVSTPELTQVGYLTPGDQKEVRDETSKSTCLCVYFLFYEQVFAVLCLYYGDHLQFVAIDAKGGTINMHEQLHGCALQTAQGLGKVWSIGHYKVVKQKNLKMWILLILYHNFNTS